ncbi:M50 family metallopeptidase, partial [Candidatus Woesearchaeota archaeon]|nr:M50 family metallopeptidase [Candidatus Woesearchaeota archaeon]
MAYAYHYSLGEMYKPIKIGPLNTSKTELKQLALAWFAVSIAFANVLSGMNFSQYIEFFIISAVAVGAGFLLHELGHKVVAQKYGCFAEFRAFTSMLVFAVVLSFTGFVFAAPGAVMISGRPGHKQNGLISLAGPLVNLALAFVFFIVLIVAAMFGIEFIAILSSYGFLINTWIA